MYPFLRRDLSSSDLTVIKLEKAGKGSVYIFLAYMAHNRLAPLKGLQHLTTTITAKKANLSIGCYASPRYTLVEMDSLGG